LGVVGATALGGFGIGFLFALFLGRKTRLEGDRTIPSAWDSSNWWSRNIRWVALAIVGLYLLGVYARMKPRGEYDYNSLAQVPVLDGGRVKPLDSVARVYL